MEIEGWDAEQFERGIDAARRTVEETAYFMVSAKKRPDWESFRPGVELIFYFALIDYETKVLIHRVMESPNDRFVWEKYLALHLHEVLERVPQAIGNAIREMRQPDTASKADPDAYAAAARDLREALKPVRQDTDFIAAIGKIRNGVAAHHFDNATATMDPSVYWMLTSATTRNKGTTPLASQIVEYSVTVASAIQTFAERVASPPYAEDSSSGSLSS